MSNQSKCEMARLRYCQKSYFGYCNAEDTDVEKCPYLKAIEEIARLAVENSKLEDDLKQSESNMQSDSGYRSITIALRMDCINGKFANRFFMLLPKLKEE